MKSTKCLIAASFLFATSLFVAERAAADGKDIFVAQKCNKCHRVTTHGIDAIKDKDSIVDLAGTGNTRDAEFFTKWLKKEIEKESASKPGTQIKHKRSAWKDSDKELAELVAWLGTLKK